MPLSTSSSEPAQRAEPVFERPVPMLGRSGWLALVFAVLLMGGWENRVRSQGVEPSYRNSDGLWAEQRRRIDQGAGDGWVLSGSSRVLFNVQLAVWERLDGRRPIQLALEGTSPVTVMEQLADDPDFTGMLLVGVAPDLFFSGYELRRGALDRYAGETPAQWFGQQVSLLVEPYLAFYNFDYALPVILRRQPLRNRDGVKFNLEVRKLANMERDRNTRMWDRLIRDEDYRKLATRIWAQFMLPVSELPPEVQEEIVESRHTQIDRAVAAYETLTARGATVIFVQMPYEGRYVESEQDFAPRALTWEVLIERTGALGLHFADHEEMQGYWLPEWSHMTGDEADRFTEAFYALVRRELAGRGR
ncbi:MAG: hypothetical protein WBN65_08295 [Gammaproteobacteria bacterium]